MAGHTEGSASTSGSDSIPCQQTNDKERANYSQDDPIVLLDIWPYSKFPNVSGNFMDSDDEKEIRVELQPIPKGNHQVHEKEGANNSQGPQDNALVLVDIFPYSKFPKVVEVFMDSDDEVEVILELPPIPKRNHPVYEIE